MHFPDHRYIDDKEKRLLAAVVRGDRQAFAQIFQDHHRTIYFVALKYLKDESLAEDALQEIFMKIWLNRSLINPELSFRSYLYAVAKNHVLNLLRHNSAVEKKIIDYTAELEHRAGSEEPDRSVEISDALRTAIEVLPKKRRVIVKLKIYKNASNQQVADRLRISINTVKIQYNLARKQLRAHFNL